MGRRRKSKTNTPKTVKVAPTASPHGDGRDYGSAPVGGADASARVVPSKDYEEKEQTRPKFSPRRFNHSSSSDGGYDSYYEDVRQDVLYIPRRFQPSGRSFRTRGHYTFWCGAYKKYVELLYYSIVEPYINSLKVSGVKLSIVDFYAFAYNNSSGYISQYL